MPYLRALRQQPGPHPAVQEAMSIVPSNPIVCCAMINGFPICVIIPSRCFLPHKHTASHPPSLHRSPHASLHPHASLMPPSLCCCLRWCLKAIEGGLCLEQAWCALFLICKPVATAVTYAADTHGCGYGSNGSERGSRDDVCARQLALSLSECHGCPEALGRALEGALADIGECEQVWGMGRGPGESS